MYAIMSDGVIHYIGENKADADVVFSSKFSSKPGSTLCEVANLKSLAKQFQLHQESFICSQIDEENMSEAASRIFEKLDELGLGANTDELIKNITQGGTKVVAEVRNLGIRGMDVIGNGFVALGELLRKSQLEEILDDKQDQVEDENSGKSKL